MLETFLSLADRVGDDLVVLAERPNLVDDELLQLGRRQRRAGAVVPAALLGVDADVVTVALVTVRGEVMAHRAAAGRAAHQALEQRAVLVTNVFAAAVAVAAQHGLHAPEQVLADDRVVLALVDLVVVADLPEVDDIRQHAEQCRLVERLAAALPALLRRPGLVDPAEFVQPADRRRHRVALQVELEDAADMIGLVRVDDQPRPARIAPDVVPEHRRAAGPLASAAGRGNLVARALADDLALELGERQQDIQRQPAHRVRRVEVLRDRDERDIVLLERLHHPGEIHERPTEAVDLVDHHAVDLAGPDVGHQALERRTIHVAAGEPAVVVAVRQAHPALGLLAGDVCLGAFALRVQRIEVLLEPLLGALARVDRAADRGRGACPPVAVRRAPAAVRGAGAVAVHAAIPVAAHVAVSSSCAGFGAVSPKKSQPFQCEPVIACATAVSDR